MKKAILIVAAIFLLLGGSAFAFQMRSGYYVGSGAARTITGLGIAPDLVIIKADTANGEPVFRTSAMSEGTAYFASASANFTDGITALGSDGFSLGINSSVNLANVRYTWTAFSGSGGGDFKVGTYKGSGVDNRSITGVGFQPDLVMVKANYTAVGYNGCWRPSSYVGDSTQYFHNIVAAANLIQNLESDGFQVGTATNVNTLNVDYYYIAFKAAAGSLNVGTYTGTGGDNVDINSPGFKPDFVLIKGATPELTVMRNNQSYGDESQLFAAAANATDNIQSFITNGFQIGTNQRVNRNAISYYYAAFKGVPATTPSGVFKMRSGAYNGDGNPNQSITGLGFKPEFIMIKSGGTDWSIFNTSLLPSNYAGYFASATAHSPSFISSIDNDGFTVLSAYNSPSTNYSWMAFANSGSTNFKVGAYTGTGAGVRSITDVGFKPDFLAIKANAAAIGIWKTASMDANTACFSAAADLPGRVISLEADGFNIGTSAEVNTAATTYFYIAFKNTPDQFNVSTYNGSTSAQSITGVGFRPGMVWVKRPDAANGAVYRNADLVGDNTQYFLNSTNLTNAIQSLEVSSFKVGTHATVNANGISYRFAAWKLTSTQLQVTGQPTDAAAGSIITPPITIEVKDQYGFTDSSDNSTQVTVAISANPGGGTISGTLTRTATAGVVTFSDISIDKKGAGYTLIAAATSLTTATTNSFNITHAAANKLAFSTQPATVAAGAVISPSVAVMVQDTYGNTVTADNTTEVTIAIGSNPGGSTLSGTLTRIATAGVVSFNNLSLEKAAAGYILSGSATGLASALSASFEVSPTTANKLIFTTQPATTSAGSLIAPAVVISIKDQYGNLVVGDNSTVVSLTLDTNPSGGALFGTVAKTAAAGKATFSDIYINKNGNYKLRGEATGLTTATSDAFDISGSMSAPIVSVVLPADGAANISPTMSFALTFNQPMDKPTTAAALLLKPVIDNLMVSLDAVAISGSVTWDAPARTIYFTPTALLNKGYTYQATLSTGAQNADLIPLATAESWRFTVTYDHSKTNAFASPDGKVRVSLAGGALPFDGNININRDPRTNPVVVDPNQITLANIKVAAEGDPNHYPLLGSITEFNAYDAGGTRISTRFADAVTIIFFYDDADNDGIVDGTTPPVHAADLTLFRLDETHGLWVKVPGSTVNLPGHYVSAPVTGFSVYTLMSNPAASAAAPQAFPNPFKPSAGHTTITFTNLPAQSAIKIFTLSGDLAKTINETSGTGQYIWDVKNEAGENLTSGLYFYVIKGSGETKTGKLVIIR